MTPIRQIPPWWSAWSLTFAILLSACSPGGISLPQLIANPPVISNPGTQTVKQGQSINVTFGVVNATSCTYVIGDGLVLPINPVTLDTTTHTGSIVVSAANTATGTYAFRVSCVNKTDSATMKFDVVVTP